MHSLSVQMSTLAREPGRGRMRVVCREGGGGEVELGCELPAQARPPGPRERTCFWLLAGPWQKCLALPLPWGRCGLPPPPLHAPPPSPSPPPELGAPRWPRAARDAFAYRGQPACRRRHASAALETWPLRQRDGGRARPARSQGRQASQRGHRLTYGLVK